MIMRRSEVRAATFAGQQAIVVARGTPSLRLVCLPNILSTNKALPPKLAHKWFVGSQRDRPTESLRKRLGHLISWLGRLWPLAGDCRHIFRRRHSRRLQSSGEAVKVFWPACSFIRSLHWLWPSNGDSRDALKRLSRLVLPNGAGQI